MKKISYLNFDLWKGETNSLDNSKIIDECNIAWNLFSGNINPMKRSKPGVQVKSVANFFPAGEVHKAVQFLVSKGETVYYEKTGIKPYVTLVGSWTYISSHQNSYTGFHTHEDMGISTNTGEGIGKLKSDLTSVYYAQVPELEDEGFIKFAPNTSPSEKDQILKFKPRAGDYFIFDNDLPHSPTLNKNSKDIRYVVAATMRFFDKTNYLEPVYYSSPSLI